MTKYNILQSLFILFFVLFSQFSYVKSEKIIRVKCVIKDKMKHYWKSFFELENYLK